ncbi:MAG: DUF4129 domain-containing protein [Acidimicrobiales bacterium]
MRELTAASAERLIAQNLEQAAGMVGAGGATNGACGRPGHATLEPRCSSASPRALGPRSRRRATWEPEHGPLGEPLKASDAVALGGLEVVLAALLFALWRRNRAATRGRGPSRLASGDEAEPGEWLQVGQVTAARLWAVLAYLLVGLACTAAIGIVVLVVNAPLPQAFSHAGRRPVYPRAPARPLARHLAHAGTSAGSLPLADIFYGLSAAVLLAAIAWLFVRAARATRRLVTSIPQVVARDYAPALGQALSEGRRALVQLDDARAAIIGCYVAMEQALAKAGAERSVAGTPDELLDVAVRSFLVDRGPAAQLTELFYEARFSSHYLGPERRGAAEAALSQLASQLGRRRVDAGRAHGAPAEPVPKPSTSSTSGPP